MSDRVGGNKKLSFSFSLLSMMLNKVVVVTESDDSNKLTGLRTEVEGEVFPHRS
jgi:hypothetical protein